MAEVKTESVPPARGLHRLTVLAVCLVWPLIWVGGLVTTYDAGMAVPDWPETYGYNLFLYPYQSWLFGPFDLFIEHGHRLLGAVVGVVAIAMVIAALRKEPRKWVTMLAIGVLLAVVSQGLLGGMRVLLGDRTLAMIHGCFGPVVFGGCVVVAAVTSRFWWRAPNLEDRLLHGVGRGAIGLAIVLVVISYAQLLLGAQIRHIQPDARPGWFAMIVAIHVMTAFLLWAVTGIAWIRLRRCGDLTLSRPSVGLIGLVAVQILLGTGTWIVNYGWPRFLDWFPGAKGFLVRSQGFFDSMVVTAHVATGALIFALSVLVLVRALRVQRRRVDYHASQQPQDESADSPIPATT